MGEDAIMVKPRKRRRLTGCCSCLVLVFFLILASGGGLFYALDRWNPEDAAWDRLPAGTVWACQAHDLKTLLYSVARDPGASRLIARGRAALNARLTDSRQKTGPDLDIMGAYRSLGWMYTLAAPNSLAVGALGSEREDFFLVFQSPVWLRWLGYLAGWDSDTVIEQEDDETGITFYFTPHEGWTIFAMTPDIIRTVLDGWDAKAMPLGDGPGSGGAHLFFAVLTGPAAGGSPPGDGGGAGPATHFTFADPFAPAGKSNDAARNDGLATRLQIRPAAAGWKIWGEMNGDGVFGSLLWSGRGDDSSPGMAFPSEAAIAPYDLTLSARLSDESREEFLAYFRSGGDPSSLPATSARSWLSESWLQNSGDAWTFLARSPAAKQDLPYPPLPWLALGWSIADGVDAGIASDRFADGLAVLLESVAAPEGHRLLQAARGAVSVSLDDAQGGLISLPPVAVNGARPAWRFDTAAMPPRAWAASDPDALPEKNRTVAPDLSQPGRGHVEMAGEWALGRDFIDSVVAVAKDRLRNLAAVRPAGDRTCERLESALGVFTESATAFPRGSVRADLDTVDRRLRFEASIPMGVDAMRIPGGERRP